MKLIVITLLGIMAVNADHKPGHKEMEEKCDYCPEDFKGFGTPASKCGCCPWPCCCKCIMAGEGPVGECRSLIDLVFVLDSSGSIGDADWQGPAKTFVNNVVGIFNDIGGDHLVGMVSYSTNATLDWNFGDPQTSSAGALAAAIKALPLKGKFTNTYEGMWVAANKVFGSPDDRPNVPNVCIVMTDGRSNFHVDKVPQIAKVLQGKALVMAIGVTKEVDMRELNIIASRPDLVFDVESYNALGSILEQVQKKVCPEPPKKEECFCCCTPEQFFGGGGAYYYMGK